MHEAVSTLDADSPVQIYVGISAGEAAEDDGDWFGTPVNEAARLCAAARPGQTLTNEGVRSLVGSRGSFAFRAVGPLGVKGLPNPVAAVEVVTARSGEGIELDTAKPGVRGRKPLLVAGVVVLLAVIVGIAALIVTHISGHSSGEPSAAPPIPPNY